MRDQDSIPGLLEYAAYTNLKGLNINSEWALKPHITDYKLTPSMVGDHQGQPDSLNKWFFIQPGILLTFLPIRLPVKQEFPIRGTIISICPTFGLTFEKCLL